MNHTTFQDLSGKIEIDLHDASSLVKLCKDKKIDMKGNIIVGLRIRGYNRLNQKNGNLDICILYIEEKEFGKDFEEKQENINKESVIQLKGKNITIKDIELEKYIKRSEIILTTRLIDSGKEIEITEDVN